jgi:toxin ParE1/3/4
MRELFFTRAAEADLLEIWSYLYQHSERAADRAIDEITDQCDLLREFPVAGRRRSEIGTDYRSLAVGNYIIFYRGKDTRVEISRVLHGARCYRHLFTGGRRAITPGNDARSEF